MRTRQHGHAWQAEWSLPGRVQAAYFDLGGEGVAYHDTDKTNHGSGELNYKYPQSAEP